MNVLRKLAGGHSPRAYTLNGQSSVRRKNTAPHLWFDNCGQLTQRLQPNEAAAQSLFVLVLHITSCLQRASAHLKVPVPSYHLSFNINHAIIRAGAS